MKQVKSSLIKAVGYDMEKERMVVIFHNGAEYVYSDVSLPVYEALVGARSVGRFYMKYIRNEYPVERR